MSFNCMVNRSVFILCVGYGLIIKNDFYYSVNPQPIPIATASVYAGRAMFPVPVIVGQLPFLLKGDHLCACVGEGSRQLTLDDSDIALLKAHLNECAKLAVIDRTKHEFRSGVVCDVNFHNVIMGCSCGFVNINLLQTYRTIPA